MLHSIFSPTRSRVIPDKKHLGIATIFLLSEFPDLLQENMEQQQLTHTTHNRVETMLNP
jgi:hypothetical protein